MTAPAVPTRGRLRPLRLGEVTITGGFWAQRQTINAEASIPHSHHWMDRLGWVDNFVRAASGTIGADHRGMLFADSEVYKLAEAMAWETARSGSADAESGLAQLVTVIGPAQEPDGYLNTAFGRAGQAPRYSNLEQGHEMYNVGHLLQAAVARARTSDADDLGPIARRAADHVCATFGPGGIERVCGHPEIELGLVELARVTGEQRYLDQAALFVERRGHGTLGGPDQDLAYSQDDVPVRTATVLRGHAVRALYLAAAAVDVAIERGDDELLAAVITQWEATVARRTYLTGGMGSHHAGERFGADFVLPPDRAYSETCAGIASVMLAWRLLLATGEARCADLIERTLFNVVATSPSPEGTAFFYANPLHQRRPGAVPDPDVESRRASTSLREPWFLVACCPTNVARTFASLAAYVATADDAGIQIHQYADCHIATSLAARTRMALDVVTDYPDDGTVAVRIAESDGGPWALTLRVPDWAHGATLSGPDGVRRPAEPGTVTIEWPFRADDVVTLDLPVRPRWTHPDPRIDAVRGCVAVEKGPLVYCAESVDLSDGRHVDAVEVDARVAPRDDSERGTVVVTARLHTHADQGWPYASDPPGDAQPPDRVEIACRPYHRWGTRGPASMRVWLPHGGRTILQGARNE